MKLEYINSTGLMAVIGDPIAHSLSPLLHNTLLQTLEKNIVYLARHIRLEDLSRWCNAARTADFIAFNATMPHKLDLVHLVDELTDDARFYGAVNSVRNDNGRLIGHNTDGPGFARALQDLGGSFAGRKVVIIGAGGAASSIALRAVQDGAAAVQVRNRTAAKAQALCSRFPAIMYPAALDAPFPTDADLVVSALALDGALQLDLSFVEHLQPGCIVCDTLYAPPSTPLLEAARARGLQADNGLSMLIYQAIYAEEFYLQQELDVAGLGRLLHERADRYAKYV